MAKVDIPNVIVEVRTRHASGQKTAKDCGGARQTMRKKFYTKPMASCDLAKEEILASCVYPGAVCAPV